MTTNRQLGLLRWDAPRDWLVDGLELDPAKIRHLLANEFADAQKQAQADNTAYNYIKNIVEKNLSEGECDPTPCVNFFVQYSSLLSVAGDHSAAIQATIRAIEISDLIDHNEADESSENRIHLNWLAYTSGAKVFERANQSETAIHLLNQSIEFARAHESMDLCRVGTGLLGELVVRANLPQHRRAAIDKCKQILFEEGDPRVGDPTIDLIISEIQRYSQLQDADLLYTHINELVAVCWHLAERHQQHQAAERALPFIKQAISLVDIVQIPEESRKMRALYAVFTNKIFNETYDANLIRALMHAFVDAAQIRNNTEDDAKSAVDITLMALSTAEEYWRRKKNLRGMSPIFFLARSLSKIFRNAKNTKAAIALCERALATAIPCYIEKNSDIAWATAALITELATCLCITGDFNSSIQHLNKSIAILESELTSNTPPQDDLEELPRAIATRAIALKCVGHNEAANSEKARTLKILGQIQLSNQAMQEILQIIKSI